MPGHEKLPRLCFVGPLLGCNPGWVTSQGEILADLLTQEGYSIYSTSTFPNRVLRLLDTIYSLIAWRREIDIVILMVFSGPSFGIVDIASQVTKWIRKPLVLWLHGGNIPTFSENHLHWVQRVLHRGDVLVSPSPYLANYISGLGYEAEVIPNVLEIDRYQYVHRQHVQPRLLWMRTFEDIYNPEMAVEVLAQLRSKYPKARLSMAGQDRGLLDSVKKIAEGNGLSGHVRFPGYLNMDGKQKEFVNHDIFINTNRVDNMPVSVVEAAAFGLPIVATSVGGIPYLLSNEQTGLLVEDEDVGGMVKAVTRLIEEPELASTLSVNGRHLAESCAWSHVKPQWEKIFNELE